ncbi:MAG: DEAD/DEAH box helicase, partial [Candidatus Competibacter phosphatis]
MTALPLKPRQQAAHDAVFAHLDAGVTRQLVALPTGVGKTVLACHIARQFPRALFLCHREELIGQTARTMARIDPNRAQGVIGPDAHQVAAFTVGMIQTVHRRLDRIDPGTFDLLIIDEAHHAAARTWRQVADHFTPRLRLGLSATPERADGAPLSNLFDEVTYSMTVAEAVAEGLLVEPTCLLCRSPADLSAVRSLGGDLHEGDLAELVNTPHRNRHIVEKYREHAAERRAVCFAAGVQHAQDLAAAFADAGITADWVSGGDPDRADKVERFAAGEFRVLANAMILTEGWDDPGVEAVLLARPTKARTLYAQMVGRGLRLAEGKRDCLIVDFVDNAGRHRLMSGWRFFGHPAPPADDTPMGMGGGESREQLVAATPIEIQRFVNLLAPPEVTFEYGQHEWHYAPATEKQLVLLAANGYDTEGTDWTRGQASQLIGGLPASNRQLWLLNASGYDTAAPWTRQQAGEALDAAARRMEAAAERMRRAGFSLSVVGRRLRVEPRARLTDAQWAFIVAHEAALVAYLAGQGQQR